MKIFLYLLYQLFKLLVKISFNIFYRESYVFNREKLRFDQAGIVTSNHPNTLVDVLNVAARTKKLVYFLANAGLFKSKLGQIILGGSYAIPIQRSQDAGGSHVKNSDSFARCDEFLGEGGVLYIAPQGVSQRKRRIDKIKTGTARIALSAENKNDFKLGLTIHPVGLTYSAPEKFRSKVIVNAGDPILVKDYQADYEKDPIGTTRVITEELKKRLEALILNTVDEEEDLLLYKIEELHQSNEWLTYDKAFFRSRKILTQLQQIRQAAPKKYETLKTNADQYFDHLGKIKIKDDSVQNNASPSTWLGLLLGLPFFIYGWINNFIACFLPDVLTRKINIYVGYDATIKILTSVFLIWPIVYSVQIFLFQYFVGNWWITLAYIISLYPLGVFAWWYKEKAQQFFNRNRLQKLNKGEANLQKDLKNQREEILQYFTNI